MILLHRFNEDAIETLFGYNADKKSGDAKKDLASKEAAQVVRILDPKKAQNLAISLRALNVSAKEVSCAVKEGNVCCHSSILCKCIALPG